MMIALCSDLYAQRRVLPRNQNLRLPQRLRSGELTRAETVRLAMNRRQVRVELRQARSDSVITPNERREIRRAERRIGLIIYRKNQDHRKRIKEPAIQYPMK